MGLLNKLLSKQQKNTALVQQEKHEQEVMTKVASTFREIKIGLDRQTASTGRPLSEIHGNARTNAIISNCGGGSKATGGKGVQGGMELFIEHGKAVGRAEEMRRNKKLNR